MRCVIVAGWAVDDEAAKTFALTFYDEILEQPPVHRCDGEGARQDEGDGRDDMGGLPVLGRSGMAVSAPDVGRAGQQAGRSTAPQHADAASPDALVVTLETIATRAEVDPPDDPRTQKQDEGHTSPTLEHQFGDTWGGMGRVAYAFGKAWVALGDREKAANWYQHAVKANDGTAPIRAAEQLANVRVRLAWDRVSNIDDGALSERARTRLAQATGEIEKRDRIAATPDAAAADAGAGQPARIGIQAARDGCGESGNEKAERDACAKMRAAYDAPRNMAQRGASTCSTRPGKARGRCRHDGGSIERQAARCGSVAGYRKLLARKREQDEDFWSAVAEFELEMIEAVAAGRSPSRRPAEPGFRRLAERVPATWMWGSVHRQQHVRAGCLSPAAERTNGLDTQKGQR